jgi:phage terminase large subunit-like protein
MSTKATKPQRRRLDAVTRLVPGYDPWATADGCIFDYDTAQLACDFFPECLTHVKGEWSGKPLVLEAWQQGIVANLFGWKRTDGSRRYRSALIYVPRKNAKTTIAAGIALYLLFCDSEPGAEIYSAAANEEQAALCFDTAKGMVFASQALARRGKIFRRVISYDEALSRYAVLSAKASTKHGLNPSGVILDELHAHKDRELAETLTSAMGARRQPLTIYTTTADYGRPSICNETHRYACQVRDGVIADSAFLPVVYEAGREDDWTAEATWKKANPNYGISVKPEFLREECQKAKDTPARENTFKRLHLNIITEQANRWLSMEKWDRGIGEVDWKELAAAMEGRECFAGLDLAATTDLCSLVLFFPNDGRPVAVPFYWVPREAALAREARDRVPYLAWAREGAIILTDGNVVDYDFIRVFIGELAERFKINEIAFDPFAGTQVSNQLTQDGHKVVAFRQGMISMNAPTKELERMVLGGVLSHGGHPVLRWNASNVTTESDAAGNLKPSKSKSMEKIDGIVSLIMGIGGHMARELGSGKSVYETRGLEVL